MKSGSMRAACVLVVLVTMSCRDVRAQSTVQGGDNSVDLWKRLEALETKFKAADRRADSAENQVSDLKAQLEDLESKSAGQGGKSYVRWGRTTCAGSGTSLVYEGFTAGAYSWQEVGNGANYVCLTNRPTWEYDKAGTSPNFAHIYGAEYKVNDDWPLKSDNVSPKKVHEQNAPCAVCETVGRGSALMIPGTHVCPQGWTQEYTGYLMTAHFNHMRGEYVCVDGSPEALSGGAGVDEGAWLYHVRTKCGSLPCGPYIANRETTCVVCSK